MTPTFESGSRIDNSQTKNVEDSFTRWQARTGYARGFLCVCDTVRLLVKEIFWLD